MTNPGLPRLSARPRGLSPLFAVRAAGQPDRAAGDIVAAGDGRRPAGRHPADRAGWVAMRSCSRCARTCEQWMPWRARRPRMDVPSKMRAQERPNQRRSAMLRFLIPALIVFNLVLFGRAMGWLPGLVGDIPDPGRISRQVNPEQLRIVPRAGVRRRPLPVRRWGQGAWPRLHLRLVDVRRPYGRASSPAATARRPPALPAILRQRVRGEDYPSLERSRREVAAKAVHHAPGGGHALPGRVAAAISPRSTHSKARTTGASRCR